MSATALTDRLEAVSGLRLRAGELLARRNTLRIGGPAELFVEVTHEEALRELLAAVQEVQVPLQILGLGSNVLIPDSGLEGVVVRLVDRFLEVSIDGFEVEVGAALPLAQLARTTATQGLRGLEALSGFPSTVGGAVYMNAGSYGLEIKDVLVSATVMDTSGHIRICTPAELDMGYRRTNLEGSGSIVTRAVLRLESGDPAEGLARIEELNRRRWQSLPSGQPNVGSIFKNPPGEYAGRLIEDCGLKGLRRGGAQISPKHANVIVNTGGATAAEVLDLMIEARRAVGKKHDIWLEPEVVLAGGLQSIWLSACSRRGG